MTPTIINRIISAVVGLALVAGGIYLITIGENIEGAGLVAGGVATVALPSVRAVPKGDVSTLINPTTPLPRRGDDK